MDGDLTVRAARDQYFRDNGLSEAGYTARWVKLKVGPIPLGFPNTRARRRAVPLHDLHHVATGYPTTWIGEAALSSGRTPGRRRSSSPARRRIGAAPPAPLTGRRARPSR